MAGSDVVFNIRERGGRQTGQSVDRLGNRFSLLGRRARHGGNDVRFFSRATVNASGHMRLFTGAVLTGAGVLGGALFLGLRKVNTAWEESRRVGTGTTAVLTSTAGAAKINRREVDALANTLSRKSGIDDEAIQSGENLLLTFRQVRNEQGRGNKIFSRSIGLATDMSAAFTAAGKSMSVQSAALLLGKALNDPAKGMTRLTRAGVSFSEQQQEQIKVLAASGDRLGAQKLILSEVEKEFGGAAARTATPLAKMRVSIENVEEALGKGLSPVVDRAAGKISKLAQDAEPRLIKLGDRLDHTFSRRDIDVSEKLRIGTGQVHRAFRPLDRQLSREIKALKLGDKIDQGIEYAIPKITDSAAAAAPHAASAFVHGWVHAGVWGKLLTLGLLERRLGIFSLLGTMGGQRFTRSFVAEQTAERGTYTALGTRLGGFIGPAMAAAAAGYLGVKLGEHLADAMTDVVTGPLQADVMADSDPAVRGARAWNRYKRRHGNLDKKWMEAHPGMRKVHNLLLDIDTQRPMPGAAGRYQSRRARQLEAYLRSVGDPMFVPRTPSQARAMHVNVYIDGKGVAHHVAVTYGKQLRKGVDRAESDKEARR